jgi:hypothetical protein
MSTPNVREMPRLRRGGTIPDDPKLRVDDKGELMLVKRQGVDDTPIIAQRGEVVLPVHAVKRAGAEIKAVLKKHDIQLPNFEKGGRVLGRRPAAKKAAPAARPKPTPQARAGPPQAQAIVIINDRAPPKRRRRRAPAKKTALQLQQKALTAYPFPPPTINLRFDNPFRGQLVQAQPLTVLPQAQGPQPLVAALDREGAKDPVPTKRAEEEVPEAVPEAVPVVEEPKAVDELTQRADAILADISASKNFSSLRKARKDILVRIAELKAIPHQGFNKDTLLHKIMQGLAPLTR